MFVSNFSFRPVNDNRASLLRSSAPPKKTPESQRDSLSRLWKNQVIMAMRLVPPIPSIAVRCASPDLSLRYVDSIFPVSKKHPQTFTYFELHSCFTHVIHPQSEN